MVEIAYPFEFYYFYTLDLTPGFRYNLTQNRNCLQHLEYLEKVCSTSPMGLFYCHASSQRLIKYVLPFVIIVIVYIDKLLVCTENQEDNLLVIDKVLNHLKNDHLDLCNVYSASS
jgi:hypothetical protein